MKLGYNFYISISLFHSLRLHLAGRLCEQTRAAALDVSLREGKTMFQSNLKVLYTKYTKGGDRF